MLPGVSPEDFLTEWNNECKQCKSPDLVTGGKLAGVMLWIKTPEPAMLLSGSLSKDSTCADYHCYITTCSTHFC